MKYWKCRLINKERVRKIIKKNKSGFPESKKSRDAKTKRKKNKNEEIDENKIEKNKN